MDKESMACHCGVLGILITLVVSILALINFARFNFNTALNMNPDSAIRENIVNSGNLLLTITTILSLVMAITLVVAFVNTLDKLYKSK